MSTTHVTRAIALLVIVLGFAGPLDWIGLFALGTGNGETQSFGWRYTDNAASGTFTLTAPEQPGVYEFRYLPDDQYTDVTRSSVTVKQP